ncbi:MAG: serine hydrolase [Rikenellaceae bacterium]
MKKDINIKKIILFTALIWGSISTSVAQDRDALDNFINDAVNDGYFPGAQIVVGNKSGVIYSNTYGYMDYSNSKAVTDETLYDLASCTKVCATTLSVMRLVDQGQLSLEAQLGDLLEFPDTIQFKNVKVKELLYHTSGFLAGVPVAKSLMVTRSEDIPILSRRKTKDNPYHFDTKYYSAKDIIRDSIYISRDADKNKVRIATDLYLDRSYYVKLDSMVWAAYRDKQRGRHVYSDLNFYLLQKIVEKITSTSLDQYTNEIYKEMKLTDIGFNPLEWSEIERITPSEKDVMLRRDTIRGFVHDDLACIQGGVCGNAGLFSTANSVAQICGMFLRDGIDYNGNRIIDSATIQKFAKIEHSPYNSSVYGLGFTKIDSKDRPYTPESYGHSGYTGTYLWIDPTKDIYVVILTNRTYPSRTNKKFNPEFRSKMWEVVMQSFSSEIK